MNTANISYNGSNLRGKILKLVEQELHEESQQRDAHKVFMYRNEQGRCHCGNETSGHPICLPCETKR